MFLYPFLAIAALGVFIAALWYFVKCRSGRALIRTLTESHAARDASEDVRAARERAQAALPDAKDKFERARRELEELERVAHLDNGGLD